MEDLELVKRLKTSDHVDEVFPNVALLEELRSSCALYDLHVKVSSIRVLHYYAQRLAFLFEKGLLVGHDVRMSKKNESAV